MSVIYDRQDDFVCWARDRDRSTGAPVLEREFYSRTVFGSYLRQRFDEIRERWRSAGAPIEVVPAYAEGFEEVGDTVLIALDGGFVTVDYVILCTGHGRRMSEPATHTDLLRPYPLTDLVLATSDCRRVAVVGAGLTAIDSVLALLGKQHIDEIAMFSRTGILPDVRADFAEDLPLTVPERAQHDGATLAELIGRFRTELAAHGITESDLQCYIERLRGGVATFMAAEPIAASDRKIQNVAISVANRDLPTYWHGFDDADRTLFDAKYFRLMQAVCSPIPLATAQTLRHAVSCGRLHIRVGVAEATPTGWRVGGESFDAVVDGTGVATSADQERFEGRLVGEGCAVAERFGGVRVEFSTGNVATPRSGRSRMYAIGYITRGSLLYSSSLYQATRNVKGVVSDIAASQRYSLNAPA